MNTLKNLLLTIFSFFLVSLLFAQSPEKFNYQAVVRDANGDVIPNKIMSFRVAIHSISSVGPLVYEETHSDTTNSFGLLTLVIGDGNVTSGNMSNIDWGGNVHVLKIEFDPDGGTNYQRLSTVQLLSVPYSLHAKTASYAKDEDADSTNEIQTLSISNDTLYLSNGGGFAKIATSVPPNYDNDSTNEIQMLSISNDTLFLSSGGQVKLPVASNNDNDSTNELIQSVAISNDSLVITEANNTMNVSLAAYNQNSDISALNSRIVTDSNRLNTLETAVNAGAFKDSSSTNEIQILSISNDTIYLSNGGFVKLPAAAANNDNDSTNEYVDSLYLSGTDLILSESQGQNRDTTSLSTLNNWTKNLDTLSVSNRYVGIGTTNPSRFFHVLNNTSSGAIQASNSSTGINYGVEAYTTSASGNTSNQFGFFSLADGAGTGDHFGMWSEAKGTGAFTRGVFGYARGTANSNQANRGVQGTAQSTSGKWNQGVYGYTEAVTSGTGFNAGIDGFAKGHSSTNFGALGQTNATGTSNYGGAFYAYGSTGANKLNYGAYGYAWGGDTNIAVYGYAADDVSNTNVGIYGRANTANGSMAGWFKGNVRIEGNLTITGSISKGSGTFKIDHPLDPENKYLVHSFVESPDMMNVYNGNITTDANGLAIVKLPSYFQASNKDFRYQLTPIGQFAQCIVKEEISSNQFVIQTDKPHVKVSWQVTGIRNDPYAKNYRIVPEEDKDENEKGKYLHPEVYGKSANEGIYNGLSNKENIENLKKVKESAELEQENP